jgi:small-conductance mechanosensitive channel
MKPMFDEAGDLLRLELLDNSLLNWGVALGAAALALVALLAARRLVLARFAALAARTETLWDNALVEMFSRTQRVVAVVLALYLGSQALTLGAGARAALSAVAATALIIQTGVWANSLLVFWLHHDRERRRVEDPSSLAATNALGFVARLVLWSVALLLVLDNIGVDVTALVAGLGVGGIAVALATQNVLGDLFASLSIALDKPFAFGDFLIIDEHLGSVEHIGLKTTRLRSLSGEQLVFSNADLLGSRIRNYGRMYERRVVFKIGVTYQTPRRKLELIPEIIREAVDARQTVRFDRSHFQAYGDFSLVFETVYYVLKPDYNTYMDIQQAINLRIHERFEEETIEFAYPTQTVHLLQAGPNG